LIFCFGIGRNCEKFFIPLLLFLFIYSCNENPTVSNKYGILKIASFNIQVFGQSKINDEFEMSHIVEIIKNFDGVAIQEIRSVEQNVMTTLEALLGDDEWDFVISDRLGRTVSKEQYAFIYRKNIISVSDTYQILDPDDQLHREPFVVYCEAGKFDFSLIIIHTDPDEVEQEVNYLDDIFASELLKEDDAILLGDLNASPSQFGELLELNDVCWVINDGEWTNVNDNKTYDNILYNCSNLTEFESGGIFNFKTELNLTDEEALKISDHYPIYAIFNYQLGS
jgi:deoxyribonuclease-1-like protein